MNEEKFIVPAFLQFRDIRQSRGFHIDADLVRRSISFASRGMLSAVFLIYLVRIGL